MILKHRGITIDDSGEINITTEGFAWLESSKDDDSGLISHCVYGVTRGREYHYLCTVFAEDATAAMDTALGRSGWNAVINPNDERYVSVVIAQSLEGPTNKIDPDSIERTEHLR